MRFAPVAPLHIHRKLADLGSLGTYHLLIASEVLKDPKGHRDFWQPRRDCFIMMDNGLIELGYSLTPDEIYTAAKIVGAQIIILPDVIGDRKQTVKFSKKGIKQLRGETNEELRFLGVVQGNSLDDAIKCATELKKLGVSMLSVPRHFGDSLGSRLNLTTAVYQETGLPIHLLGFSEHIFDDIQSAVLPGVTGIDSAVPVWLGLDPRREFFERQPPVRANFGRRPPGYWEMDTDDMFVVEGNVHKVQSWLNVARGVHTVETPSGPEEFLTHP